GADDRNQQRNCAKRKNERRSRLRLRTWLMRCSRLGRTVSLLFMLRAIFLLCGFVLGHRDSQKVKQGGVGVKIVDTKPLHTDTNVRRGPLLRFEGQQSRN